VRLLNHGHPEVVHVDEKPANRIGDTATCLRVAGEMIRDNVLYHSLSALPSGHSVVCPRQRLSAHWFAPAKCAHLHFESLGRFSIPILIFGRK